MRVGVDGWRIHGTTGVPRYLTQIVSAWCTGAFEGTRFERAAVYTPRPIDRARVPLGGPVAEVVIPSRAPQLLWQNTALRRGVDADVLWCPSYTIPWRAGVPTVVTTHDVTYMMHPGQYPWTNRWFYNHLYGISARAATLVVTHNQSTADEVTEYLGVPAARVRAVPLAPSEMFRRLEDRDEVARARVRLLGDDRPYFLCVGKISLRRNLPIILEGFARLKRDTDVPHRLVVVGRNKLDREVADIVAELGLQEQVVHFPFAPDDDLVMLYNGTDAFVTAATYEGNSLTSIEAQATGAPVVIPDVRGMREMTAEIALILPEISPEAMAEALHRLAVDGALRARLSEQGMASAARFTWARSARETLAVLEEAVETGRAR